jgi:nicotinamide-nucleotide amidase
MEELKFVRRWFQERRKGLAVAESLTSGELQRMIGEHPGVSDFFHGGLTAYSIEVKVKLLGVDEAHARAVNAVSAQVALEMARGACALFNADFGLATTGYAEPFPARGIKHPLAHVAIFDRGAGRAPFETIVRGRWLDRTQMQRRTARAAIVGLARVLRSRNSSAT